MGKRDLFDSDSSISVPQTLARYTGTKGSTQGEKKESSPAPKATASETSSIIYATKPFYQKDN